jgi:hypothetical protein
MKSRNKSWWIKACTEEIKSLQENKVFSIVINTPTGKVKILSSRWVFKTKRDSAGAIERFKARVVVRGFLQERTDAISSLLSRQR